MMVDGAEEGQFRGPIDVLAPYTSRSPSDGTRNRCRNTSHIVVFLVTSGPYGTAFKPRCRLRSATAGKSHKHDSTDPRDKNMTRASAARHASVGSWRHGHHYLRRLCSLLHDGHVRPRRARPPLHPGLCRRLSPLKCLRVPRRSVALRRRRGHLVGGSTAAICQQRS